jgi:hypothetical protein
MNVMGNVKFSLCLTKHCAMEKYYWGVDVYTQVLLTSALVGGEWSAWRSYRFTPRKSSRWPLVRRLGGLQSRSENPWPCRDLISDPLVFQLYYSTALPQFIYTITIQIQCKPTEEYYDIEMHNLGMLTLFDQHPSACSSTNFGQKNCV